MTITTIIKKAASLLLLVAVAPIFAADGVKVAEVSDFGKVGAMADEKRVPILLMFSAEHCGFCRQLEEDFLKPMLRSGDYDDKVMIRKLKIDSYEEELRDFAGNKTSPADFAERYNVYVTPTVVFIDGDGVELAQKRVGLTTPAFYGGYLDQAIDDALNILRRDKPMRVKLSALKQ